MTTELDVMSRISSASRAQEFEELARDIEAAGLYSQEVTKALGSRLAEIGLDLSERLRAYGQRIMDAGEPSFEDLYKVFSLMRSLAILEKIGLAGAADSAAGLAASLQEHSARDERYHAAGRAVFGSQLPSWWRSEDA